MFSGRSLSKIRVQALGGGFRRTIGVPIIMGTFLGAPVKRIVGNAGVALCKEAAKTENTNVEKKGP